MKQKSLNLERKNDSE